VDGSEASDEAVVEAAEVAATFGAPVHVLHVLRLATGPAGALVESEEDAQAIVTRALVEVARRGVPATGEVLLGYSVARSIASVAARIGSCLVLLGSRRPSHFDGLMLGSVGHDAVHQLRCPVLLARRVRTAEPAV
jgi:nucleotide-binding universal stress UspA family protein